MRRRPLLRWQATAIASVLLFTGCASSRPGSRSESPAGREPFDRQRLDRIRELVDDAVERRLLPGAVILVGHRGQTIYREAFGRRALVPEPEPMSTDTVFDIASLTKIVATTPAVLMLVEQGRIGLDDSIARVFPELGRYGKERISVRHLLAHTSGLRADLDLALPFEGTGEALRLVAEEVPVATPGERVVYSDINFIILGELIRRVSGQPLERFVADRIFRPLSMTDTMFRPGPALHARIAPTEACPRLGWPCGGPDAVMLRGTVHDPTARRMGGVAGHAGLFSTADDLAQFCRMVLNGGSLDHARVLGPLAARLMTDSATSDASLERRGLGWDVDSRFSSNRGDLFPIGSFGHTGWTGTSIWIDPFTDTFIVFLSNRVHPDGKGDVVELRERIATIVAAALNRADLPPHVQQTGGDFGARPITPANAVARQPVMAGIDVLAAGRFELLRGRRIGLLTNHTGLTSSGQTTIDVLHAVPDLSLLALFSPEHGIRGTADEKVHSGKDERTGLPIHSLYGDTRRPTSAMLDGLDTLVIDLQDVGARFYTYMTTMAYVMEEAAKRNLRVFVLDRPNPINGLHIEGPIQDDAAHGFTAYHPMPVRHGLTLGELARLFNGERALGVDLSVVAMRHWSRELWFDGTGLAWTNPSPNMRNMHQATLYPGIGSLEFANISVGRGTDTPFEQIGAPWIDGARLAAYLNGRRLPGIQFYPVGFTPSSSVYAAERCSGVFMIVTDREALRPVRIGLEIAGALFKLHGDRFDPQETWRLLGSREAIDALRRGVDPAEISRGWAEREARWRNLRAKYLLY